MRFTQPLFFLVLGFLAACFHEAHAGDGPFLFNGIKPNPSVHRLPPLDPFTPITSVRPAKVSKCSPTEGMVSKKRSLHKGRQATCDYGFNASLPCENPEIRALYAAALSPDRYPPDVPEPMIRYNVVVFQADNGTDPSVPDLQIQMQDAVLNDAFTTSHLTFNLSVTRYNQSILRYRVVITGPCDRMSVLNNVTDPACMFASTGWDGGSGMCTNANCDPACDSYDDMLEDPVSCPCICVPEYFNCVPDMLNNRYCNPECNYAQWDWDGGDCCPPTTNVNNSFILPTLTCRDPNNPLRNWIDSYDLYYYLNLNGAYAVNVIVAPGDMGIHNGQAKLPNDPNYFTNQGGIILNTNNYAFGVYLAQGYTGVTFVHMMGHVLGLLHTHAGVTDLITSVGESKAAVCRDPCQEQQPLLSQPGSSTTGDLVNDTRPTPENTLCSDPAPCTPSGEPFFCTDCSGQAWLSTPYNNYMGFATDSCPKDFTIQQMGRMYCYVDLFIRNQYLASGQFSPGPILYAPLLSDSQGSIRVDWSGSFPFETGTTASSSTFSWLIQRNPPLADLIQVDGSTFFLDNEINANTFYTYRVRLEINGQLSTWSPWATPIALPRVCNCRPWDMNGVVAGDHIRSNGACSSSSN